MTLDDIKTKFDQFVAQNKGKQVIVLPSSRSNGYGQCFDLAVAWTDFLGIPHYQGNPSPFPYPNASQIYTDFGAFQSQYFERIPNTEDFIPQKGDIGVYAGGLNGGIGDVFICTGKGDTNTFEGFNQNWLPKQPATLITHTYNYFLGVLRLKVTQPSTQPTMDTNWKQILDYAKGKFLVNEAKDVIKYIEELDAYRKSESAEKDKKQAQIETLEKENLDLSESLDTERSNHQAELAKKDEECKAKIQAIQDIPPKVIEKTVQVPYQFHSAVYRAMDEFLRYIDKNGLKLPVDTGIRK